MPAARRRPLLPLIALALAAALSGCGKSSTAEHAASGGPSRKLAPVTAQGAVSLATRNTTRLGGAEAAANAAAVARAVYPGLTPETRPHAVVVVDEANWAAALAASALAAAPTGAPLLYAAGGSLPAVSSDSLEAMHPAGLPSLGGAQVINVGAGAGVVPAGLQTRTVAVGEPAVTAASIAQLMVSAAGGAAPRQVIVVAANAPHALLMPAAGLAAESGSPILFVTSARVPLATQAVLSSMHHPAIYVVAPEEIRSGTISVLRRLGSVTEIKAAASEGTGAVANAIAVARFTDGSFGWGVKEPGHGLVFVNATLPLDAPAAALLSATGDYGPLLLLEHADEVPSALAAYLGDIQPAYTSAPQFRPVRGVYNHGWLIGDEAAISSVTQAEIDSLLEISPRKQSSEEASVTQAE
jgi:hypothetical protein